MSKVILTLPFSSRESIQCAPLECKTPEAARHLESATFVLGIRRAMVEIGTADGDGAYSKAWLALDRALSASKTQSSGSRGGAGGVGRRNNASTGVSSLEVVELAKTEVERATNELHNFVLIRDMHRGLQTGKPEGDIGSMDLASASLVDIDKAIGQVAILGGCQTEVASILLDVVQGVRKLRLALIVGDWDGARGALSDLDQNFDTTPASPPSQLDDGSEEKRDADAEAMRSMGYGRRKLPAEAADEIARARDEVNNRTIIRDLRGGLTTDMAAGTPGDIMLAVVQCDVIASAIEQAESIGCKTFEARNLLRTAKVIHSIREALMADDWEAVGKQTMKMNDDGPLHDVALSEVALARDEYQNRTILRETSDAMSAGMATGDVGNMDVSTVETGELEDAVSHAELLGCKTADAATHLASARFLLHLRLRLVEAVDHGTANVGPAGEAMGASLWDRVAEVVTASKSEGSPVLVRAADKERSMAQLELQNRVTVADLSDALLAGRAVGQAGALDISSVKTASLNEAIERAQSAGCHTEQANGLLRAAKQVFRVRVALLDDMWVAVAEATPSSPRALDALDPVCHAELSVVRDEVNDRNIKQRIRTSFACGMATGSVGSLDMQKMDVRQLDAAIAEAQLLGSQTEEAEQLVWGAQILRLLRAALLHGEVKTAQEALHQLQTSTIADEVRAEIELVEAELANRSAVTSLEEGLASGCALGATGEMDISTIEHHELAGAIDDAEVQPLTYPPTLRLLHTAGIVLELRQGLRTGDWVAVAAAIARAMAPSDDAEGSDGNSPDAAPDLAMGDHGRPLFISDIAVPEVRRAQLEVADRRVTIALTAALSHGAAQGEVGRLDVSNLDTNKLEEALAMTSAQDSLTAGAIQLSEAAKIILRVRQGLRRGDWEALESAIGDGNAALANLAGSDADDDVGQDGGVVNHVTLELRDAQHQVENRNIVHQFISALSTGLATGDTGKMETASIVLGDLTKAIKRAEEVTCRSMEAKQLLSTAQIMRQLRQALRADDWDKVHLVLEESEDVGVAPVAEHEQQAALDEAENRTICRELREALSSGGPTGETGQLDISTVDVGPLRAAVALAEEIGCKTAGARELLSTAKVVLRVRKALKDTSGEASAGAGVPRRRPSGGGSWNVSAVRDVLSSAEGIRIAAVARPEMSAVQAEVDSRIVTSELMGALSIGAARGRVGALDRSSIDVEELNNAITLALDLGCRTASNTTLLETVQMVRRLRIALATGGLGGDGDWDEMEILLASGPAANVHPSAQDEVELYRHEMHNRAAIRILSHVLTQSPADVARRELNDLAAGFKAGFTAGGAGAEVGGASRGETHRMDQKGVADLDRAIARVSKLSNRTAQVNRLFETAQLVRRLRVAIANGDAAAQRETLTLVDRLSREGGDSDSGHARSPGGGEQWDGIDPVASGEITAARRMMDSLTTVEDLEAALAIGGPMDDVGAFDASLVSTTILSEALARGESLGRLGRLDLSAQSMLAASRHVLSARHAVESHDWPGVTRLVVELEALKAADAAAHLTWPAVIRREVDAVGRETELQRTVKVLVDSISSGAATFEPGWVDCSTVSCVPLERALIECRTFGPTAAGAMTLIVTGGLVLKLRRSLVDGDWDQVKSVLEQCDEEVRSCDELL